MNRKYLPTFSELIDRLSIVQLKEVFIPEHKAEYAQEIEDIVHDINECAKELDFEKVNIGELIRNIIIVSDFNLHIWHNETLYRQGLEGGDLHLTHSLNGVRNRAKNKIQEIFGGRKDYKVDCLAADHTAWEPSWGEEKEKI